MTLRKELNQALTDAEDARELQAALGWLINRRHRVDGPSVVLQFESEEDARAALAKAQAAYDKAKGNHP